MIKKIVMASILAMGALNSPVQAASLVLSGFSYHLGTRQYEECVSSAVCEWKDLNEKNGGVGFELDNGLQALVMKNSYYKTSVVLSKGWKWDINDRFAYGVRIGMASGYHDTPANMPIVPVAQGELQMRTGPWTTVLGAMPSFSGDSWGVLTLHGKYRF